MGGCGEGSARVVVDAGVRGTSAPRGLGDDVDVGALTAKRSIWDDSSLTNPIRFAVGLRAFGSPCDIIGQPYHEPNRQRYDLDSGKRSDVAAQQHTPATNKQVTSIHPSRISSLDKPEGIVSAMVCLVHALGDRRQPTRSMHAARFDHVL
jgi:hypothetical protein